MLLKVSPRILVKSWRAVVGMSSWSGGICKEVTLSKMVSHWLNPVGVSKFHSSDNRSSRSGWLPGPWHSPQYLLVRVEIDWKSEGSTAIAIVVRWNNKVLQIEWISSERLMGGGRCDLIDQVYGLQVSWTKYSSPYSWTGIQNGFICHGI